MFRLAFNETLVELPDSLYKFEGHFLWSGPIWESWISTQVYSIYLSLTAGIIEEIVYRGILITYLISRSVRPVLAGTISIAVFTGIHWTHTPSDLIGVIFFATIATIYFIRKRKLVPLIIWHVAYDYLIFASPFIYWYM